MIHASFMSRYHADEPARDRRGADRFQLYYTRHNQTGEKQRAKTIAARP
jgi:hypothetical protein